MTYTENSEHDKDQSVKELFRIKGTELIQKKLGDYVKELKEEYAKDLVLPTKDNVNKSGDKKPEQVKSVTKILSVPVTSKSTDNPLANLKSLKFEEEFKVSVIGHFSLCFI